MKFIITVDVEADNQWLKEMSKNVSNVFELPRFHNLVRKFGFKPTYLMTYEVADNERAVNMLKGWQDSGEAEVGAHFHPWSTSPFGDNDKYKRFPSELKDDELRLKLENLTKIITEKIGIKPTSYRAGRWGFDNRQIKILSELGYVADCSISPKVDWSRNNNITPGSIGPDWSFESIIPHNLELDGKKILEVPMTIINTGFIYGSGGVLERFILKHPANLLARVIRKFFIKPRWLRAFKETKVSDWEAIYKSALKNRLPVIEFMIHSSELVSGGSPYVKNEKDLETLYKNLEALFEILKSRGVLGTTLSEFVADFKG